VAIVCVCVCVCVCWGGAGAARQYDVAGGMQDYHYYYARAMEITVEASCAKWPAEATLPAYWAAHQGALWALATLPLRMAVAGTVVAADGGRPLAGATVTLDEAPTWAVAADAHGAFWRLAAPGQRYTVRAAAPGHYTDAVTVSIEAGQTWPPVVTLALRRDPTQAIVLGVVLTCLLLACAALVAVWWWRKRRATPSTYVRPPGPASMSLTDRAVARRTGDARRRVAVPRAHYWRFLPAGASGQLRTRTCFSICLLSTTTRTRTRRTVGRVQGRMRCEQGRVMCIWWQTRAWPSRPSRSYSPEGLGRRAARALACWCVGRRTPGLFLALIIVRGCPILVAFVVAVVVLIRHAMAVGTCRSLAQLVIGKQQWRPRWV
jgi:hypothetical protein